MDECCHLFQKYAATWGPYLRADNLPLRIGASTSDKLFTDEELTSGRQTAQNSSMSALACSRQLSITSECPIVTALRYEQPMLHVGGF
jgi:hypothetical protein